MTQEYPITPPDYLVKQWSSMNWQQGSQAAFADAARWGADMELESCCKLLELSDPNAREFLYAARRPKPPSLKEQALDQLGCIKTDLTRCGMGISVDTIRRALESLPD